MMVNISASDCAAITTALSFSAALCGDKVKKQTKHIYVKIMTQIGFDEKEAKQMFESEIQSFVSARKSQ